MNLDSRDQAFWAKKAMRLKIMRRMERFKASLLPNMKREDIRIEFHIMRLELKRMDMED